MSRPPLVESPFHPGEVAVQTRMGVQDEVLAMGRQMIRGYLSEQHQAFFRQLPFVLLGAIDASGQPWTTMLCGRPGFMQSPDRRHLEIAAPVLVGDPLQGMLQPGSDVGLLGIELPTRRRNRLNGIVAQTDERVLTVEVVQSFGNCPQYIQTRQSWVRGGGTNIESGRIETAAALSADDRALITAADTFFIATTSGPSRTDRTRGIDVSHRGGKPGFVRVDGATLTVPDFVGNFLFNTLGNLQVDARAGLLFIDWSTGTLLHLTGRAEVIWEGPEVTAFAGAERLVKFHVDALVRRPGALPLRFSAPGYSPMLDRTGDWRDAAQALAVEQVRNTWRSFRVAEAHDESSVIRSLRLVPADDGGVAPHQPGQHLPIRIRTATDREPLIRHYTLSDAADGRSYRVSVKREGAVSSWLHQHGSVGSLVEVLAPRGSFTFAADSQRSVVLLSAGVGITPMIAILNSLLVNDGRSRHPANVFFIHGARNSQEHAFAQHVRDKADLHGNLGVHICYSDPLPTDRVGYTHDSTGRVGIELLKSILPADDYDYYLCGPGPFMSALYEGLRSLNVADARIRFESFGPSSVKRHKPMSPGVVKTVSDTSTETIEVKFARSGKTANWRSDDGTLLEFAEAQGLEPAFSCRSGSCGTCATRLLSGAVECVEPPLAEIDTGDVLICCARPRTGASVTLDL